MPSTSQIFAEEFESLRVDLVKKYDELGMRASGKWAESTEVESGEFFGRVIGAPYTDQLESGRGPTVNSGDGDLVEAIEQWIIDKGIVGQIEDDISVSSLAFLIARKIHREGWKRQEHGGVELVTLVVTPKRIQSIIDRLGDSLIMDFTSQFISELKTIKL